MTKSLVYGPNGSGVEGVPSLTTAVQVLNFEDDFALTVDDPGQVVYVDTTTPTDQLSTLRIASKARPNVYAGTSIDPSVFLPNKGGVDVVIEVREVWAEVDSADTSYLRQFPVRGAFTFTVPLASSVTGAQVKYLLSRVAAGLFKTGSVSDAGIEAILHGSLRK